MTRINGIRRITWMTPIGWKRRRLFQDILMNHNPPPCGLDLARITIVTPTIKQTKLIPQIVRANEPLYKDGLLHSARDGQ
jgi:hypothetical protein